MISEGDGKGLGRKPCYFSWHCCKSANFSYSLQDTQGKIAGMAILADFAAWMPHRSAFPSDTKTNSRLLEKSDFQLKP